MRDEDLERLEQGDPESPAEVIIGLAMLLGTIGLLVLIIGVLL